MSLTPRKLLTIVVEAAIERQVAEELERAGVRGSTVVNARGSGDRGRREGDWEQSRSLRIETVGEESVLVPLAQKLLDRFGPDFALVLWLQDVEVLRGSKFGAS